MKKFLILLAVLLAVAGCKKGEDKGAKSPYITSLSAGSPAVDFLYKDMDGKPFRLSEKKGSVVILYFWRMKCGECKTELKGLEALYNKYKERGLIIVAVGADTMHSSPISEVREFLKDSSVTFITIRDSDGFVSEAYQVLRAPHAFIIDKKGTIASVMSGPTDWTGAETEKLIESLL